jgi:hypothetical protein
MLSIRIDTKVGFKTSKLVWSMESFAMNQPQNVMVLGSPIVIEGALGGRKKNKKVEGQFIPYGA